ncbi:unnamed protein product, partial [Symbiodinium pilosum]
ASHLVPGEAVAYWSGHSARHVLPSLAAAIGVPDEKINFLGRWAAAKSASSTYVQTSRQVIHQVQSAICTSLLEGVPKPGYIEEELLQDLNEFGVARGLTNGLLIKAHTVLEWDRESQTWSLGGKFPAISVEAASLDRALAEARITEAPHEAEPVPDAPFFVTVSRSGFRRLHVSKTCAVRQERCLEWTSLQQVTAECADAVCKLRKPRLDSLEDISRIAGWQIHLGTAESEWLPWLGSRMELPDGVTEDAAVLYLSSKVIFFALDGAADLPSRAAVAAIISAWESCQHFAVKEAELKAAAKVLGVTRPVTQTDRMAMKVSYEKTYGTIEDSVEPSDDYLSSKLEELESHEPCASQLSEVTSKKNAGTMGIQTSVDTSGHVRIVKSKQKDNFVKNREMLRDMTPRVWEGYTNFLLGERCFLMKIHGGGVKGMEGSMLRPPWHILLSFEYELRKEAIKKAHHDNRPLKDTLAEVVKDPELKERFFTKCWRAGQAKGKPSKGKSDKAGKSNNGLVDRTPDGREICFAFNAQGCDGTCGRIHICRVRGCGEAHAMWEHFRRLSLKGKPDNATAAN